MVALNTTVVPHGTDKGHASGTAQGWGSAAWTRLHISHVTALFDLGSRRRMRASVASGATPKSAVIKNGAREATQYTETGVRLPTHHMASTAAYGNGVVGWIR